MKRIPLSYLTFSASVFSSVEWVNGTEPHAMEAPF